MVGCEGVESSLTFVLVDPYVLKHTPDRVNTILDAESWDDFDVLESEIEEKLISRLSAREFSDLYIVWEIVLFISVGLAHDVCYIVFQAFSTHFVVVNYSDFLAVYLHKPYSCRVIHTEIPECRDWE